MALLGTFWGWCWVLGSVQGPRLLLVSCTALPLPAHTERRTLVFQGPPSHSLTEDQWSALFLLVHGTIVGVEEKGTLSVP